MLGFPMCGFSAVCWILILSCGTCQSAVYSKDDKETSEPASNSSHVASDEATEVRPRLFFDDLSVSGKAERGAGGWEPALEDNATAVFGSLEDVLDLYSTARLQTVWNSSAQALQPLGEGCRLQFGTYLDALANNSLWALKVSDASGRYSGNFFWGNSYWVGSQTLCSEVSNAPGPPFALGFYSLRANIYINKKITPHVRTLLLGVCLPLTCSGRDATHIVRLSASQAPLKVIEVVTLKSPQEYYKLYEDNTFWTLVIVGAVMLVLLVLGTGLDFYLEYSAANPKHSNYYDNYTFQIAKSLEGTKVIAKRHRVPITDSTTVPNSGNGSACESSESNSMDGEEFTLQGVLKDVMLAFSVRKNMLTICDPTVGVDTIPLVHGLRSISMGWVILGHTCIVVFKYSDNMSFRSLMEKEFNFQAINNGTFSVDTFFFISGLLVSFLYFRTTAKHDVDKLTKATGLLSNFIEFISLLVYRFGRLTAPYLYMIGVVQVSSKWFYYNSVFEPPAADHINCANHWWRNILYINTLWPVKDMCMLWSWYLADDTQFYILGIVLLIIAVRHFRVAATLMAIFLITSWFTTAYIAYVNEHIPNVDDPLALFDKIYDKPWTRLGPYLVGMCVGWVLFKTNCTIKMNTMTVVLGWIGSLSVLLFLVFGLFQTTLHPITAAAYSSLSHSVWALALAWIVIACTTGYGGYINRILSTPHLYPFSRVTYCAYLVHPVIIRSMAMRMDSPIHLGRDIVTIMFFGQLVAAYLLAFVISLAFEAPFVSLLRIISPTKRKHQ